MYISIRAAVVKNLIVAIANGTITLILLLIAPLGLAAVIGNTFMVTVATFFVATFSDTVASWLNASQKQTVFKPNINSGKQVVHSKSVNHTPKHY
jgi:hypothetical protein